MSTEQMLEAQGTGPGQGSATVPSLLGSGELTVTDWRRRRGQKRHGQVTSTRKDEWPWLLALAVAIGGKEVNSQQRAAAVWQCGQ